MDSVLIGECDQLEYLSFANEVPDSDSDSDSGSGETEFFEEIFIPYPFSSIFESNGVNDNSRVASNICTYPNSAPTSPYWLTFDYIFSLCPLDSQVEGEENYDIYDIMAQHSSNVQLEKAIDIIVKGLGFGYYFAVLYSAPIPAGGYLIFKFLKENDYLDDYCNPKNNEIILGYTVCDIVEESLLSFTIYNFGGKISQMITGVGGWRGIALDYVAETLMKTLLIKSPDHLENAELPENSEYVSSFSQVAASDLTKLTLKVAIGPSHSILINIMKLGVQHSVGQLAKYSVRHYLFSMELPSVLKPVGSVTSSIVCKTLVPDFKSDAVESQIFGQCIILMRRGASLSIPYIGEGYHNT